MEKIYDISQLNSLILLYLKKGVITNNFTSLEEYKLYLEEGSLYYENTDNILMLFREVNGIYHTYFYINAFEKIKIPRNIVVEIVNPSNELTEYLLKLGLKLKKNRLEMEFQHQTEGDCKLLVKPSQEDRKEAYDIVLNSFDNAYGWIPTQREFFGDDV